MSLSHPGKSMKKHPVFSLRNHYVPLLMLLLGKFQICEINETKFRKAANNLCYKFKMQNELLDFDLL